MQLVKKISRPKKYRYKIKSTPSVLTGYNPLIELSYYHYGTFSANASLDVRFYIEDMHDKNRKVQMFAEAIDEHFWLTAKP